ncbi:MAG: hypothetical protein WA960_09655 [Tunicatimonas sp.]
MKSLSLITALVLIFNLSQAAAPSYQQAMEESIASLNQASDSEQLLAVANRFERIARAEKDEWLPWYYAAYATLNRAIESDGASEKDQLLDEAQQYLDEATAVRTEESELVALQGYVHTIRVTVDPATRGQQLAPLATKTLVQALKMNPDNPRALFLLGQMQYGTAQFFGADTSEACQLIQQAVAKYESVTIDDALMPSWGEKSAQRMSEQCGK